MTVAASTCASQAAGPALSPLELFDERRPAGNATEATAVMGVHRATTARLRGRVEPGVYAVVERPGRIRLGERVVPL